MPAYLTAADEKTWPHSYQDNFAGMTDVSMLIVFGNFNHLYTVTDWIQFPREEIQRTLQTYLSGIPNLGNLVRYLNN